MSTIRTLDRAFSIIRMVAQYPDGIGLSAVASELDLAKSTASRMLAALESWEIVTRLEDNLFIIGPEAVRWAGFQSFTATLSALAYPILQQVSSEIGESVAICILQGLQVLFLDHVQSQQDILVRDWTGERIPVHTSSAGIVLLAYSEPDVVEKILKRPLSSVTEQSITDPEDFRAHLKEAREKGYSISDGFYADGVFGMSLPIFNRQGKILAALNMYGPKFRLKSATKQREILEIMRQATARLIP